MLAGLGCHLMVGQAGRTIVSTHYLKTEPLLNQIEVAIRAYDPCLSCATHAMGKMPLEVVLVNEQNEVVDRLEKRITGDIQRTCP